MPVRAQGRVRSREPRVEPGRWPAKELKSRPSYAIASVDHALRIATMLQLEGVLTESQVADRLGVARSTAHRLLAMLVYRDFAVQDEGRVYRAGPVLELAAHSQSQTSRLRTAALPHLRPMVDMVDESANLIIRTGDTARFIASVECEQSLRVGTREGMVFPAHRVTGGLLLLAEIDDEQLEAVYAAQRYADRPSERPDLTRLRADLERIRATGYAVNEGLSERGLVAVSKAVRSPSGAALAGVSISMPSVRYDVRRRRSLLAALGFAVKAIEADLARQP